MMQEAANGSSATGSHAAASVCLICADSPVEYWAIGSCQHPYCWRCSLRLRILFKSKACPLCKTELETVLFSANPDQTFLPPDSGHYCDKRLGIVFLDEGSRLKTASLISLSCPIQAGGAMPPCKNVFLERGEFVQHAKKSHGLFICDVCYGHQRYFLPEVPLFDSLKALHGHQLQGDGPRPGALLAAALLPSSGPFKGHPRCDFCQTFHYSTDELYEHCRDRHESCFVCERYFHRRYQYFPDYMALERHFREEHHPCSEDACLERKFVVFASELDLKAHQQQVHRVKGVQRSEQRRQMAIQIDLEHGTLSSAEEGQQQQAGRRGPAPSVRARDARGTRPPSASERQVSPPTPNLVTFFPTFASNRSSSPVHVQVQRDDPSRLDFGAQRFPSLSSALPPPSVVTYRPHAVPADAFPTLYSAPSKKPLVGASVHGRPNYAAAMGQGTIRLPPLATVRAPPSSSQPAPRGGGDDFPALNVTVTRRAVPTDEASSPRLTPAPLFPVNVAHVKKGKSKVTYRLA